MRIGVLGRIFGKRDGKGGGPEAFVGAFGKHPAWNDHIEDIGLDTQRLVEAKRSLYVEGIGGNIDSGVWDSLDDKSRLEGFGHLFLWSQDDECLIGRMWSSSDGKGRTKYPMMVVAHLRHASRAAHAATVEALIAAESACRSTTERTGVIDAVSKARDRIRASLGVTADGRAQPSAESAPSFEGIIQSEVMGPNLTGVERVIYQIERDMGAYLRDSGSESGSSRMKSINLRPQHLRAPACISDSWGSIEAWNAFMLDLVDELCPLLVIRRDDAPWVELIVGAPGPGELFCLRAGLAAVPAATEVPYTIDAALAARVREWISSRQQAPVRL